MKSKVMWGPDKPWKSESAWWGYIRGCLRKAWNRHPTKLNLIKSKRKQIPNPNPRGKKETVYGFTCPLCSGTFVLAQGEVDHIHSAGSLKSVEDIQGFVERLLFVTEDDLRLICKTDHAALTYAEKEGISFEDAKIEKQAIELCKKNVDKQWLLDHHLVPASSKDKRRAQIITYLKEHNE